jgi:hypothetical protein
MKIRALGIIEPPGMGVRLMPGQKADVPDEYGALVCAQRLAEPVAVKPRDRAETRPRTGAVETRRDG